MKEFVFDVKGKKISRFLPKSWGNVQEMFSRNWVDVPNELGNYCEMLFTSLSDIKKFDEKEFNKDNTYTIDEYIGIFDSVYKQIVDLLLVKEKYIQEQNIARLQKVNFYEIGRFDALTKENFKKDAFLYTIDRYPKAFRDETYSKVLPLVKKLFMIEKMCSFTTRKLWENQITKIEDLDTTKKFKILVKAIFPQEWRCEKLTRDLLTYYKSRIYESTSLIDEKHTHNIFQYYDHRILAALIVDFELKNMICGDRADTYSEEYVDNSNPLKEKSIYSDIFLQEDIDMNGKNHKLYAEAVQTITPNSVLNQIGYYSEINIRNAKPVAVFVPNKDSITFCKNVAKKNKLPLFYDESIK